MERNTTDNGQEVKTEKKIVWMMHLLERAALYLDYNDQRSVKKLTEALDETVESLTDAGLNPLSIALERLKK